MFKEEYSRLPRLITCAIFIHASFNPDGLSQLGLASRKPGISAEGNAAFRLNIYPMPVRFTVSGGGNVGRRPCDSISLLVNMCRSCTSEENIADPLYRLRNARQFETRRQGKRKRCHAELWHTADHFMNSSRQRKYEPMQTAKMVSVCIASSQLPIRLA